MPNLVDKDHCCGCSACANICPKQVIIMKPNDEGFLHPVVDEVKCVECKACEKVCPGLMPARKSCKTFRAKAYTIQHKDDSIRFQSTSGGAFTAIAEEVIRRLGTVYGAAMTEELKVKHIAVTKVEELSKFRNSKYVQSEIGSTYKDVKKNLTDGQMVCFSGTPCQINGLYKYLGRDYENLIAVDVVCKSVPSPLVFDKYVQFKQQQEKQISDIVFRDKKRGFLYCTMAHYPTHEARSVSESNYRRGSESDEWLRMFLSGNISRKSCTTCQYQTLERVGDITLGDIWETGQANWDDNKGTTLVHVWTAKGLALLDSITGNIRYEEFPLEKSRGTERKNTIEIKSNREQLFKDANSMTPERFFNKYAPYNVKVRAKKIMRYVLWLLNLQTGVRHIKHLIIHRPNK